jgi:putative ABC transport system substrate-binding protein
VATVSRRAHASPFRVAWLSPNSMADGSPFLDEIRVGLRDLGYVEGRTLVLERYWGENTLPRAEKNVSDAIASAPNVIVALGPTAVLVGRTTTTIPIVFGYSGDPVEAKMVDSLARPGRNMTGLSYMVLELVGKRMQLLREVLPKLKRVAVVAHPQHPGDQAERKAAESGAAPLGIGVQYFELRGGPQLPDILAAIEKSTTEAVMLFPVQNVIVHRERIAAWAIKHRMPSMSGWAQFAEGGNLMSYGPNLRDASRRMAVFVDKILKGTRPADIPVEQPTKVELVVNLKAAQALGVTVPQTVLLRADHVIT